MQDNGNTHLASNFWSSCYLLPRSPAFASQDNLPLFIVSSWSAVQSPARQSLAKLLCKQAQHLQCLACQEGLGLDVPSLGRTLGLRNHCSTEGTSCIWQKYRHEHARQEKVHLQTGQALSARNRVLAPVHHLVLRTFPIGPPFGAQWRTMRTFIHVIDIVGRWCSQSGYSANSE